MAKHVKASPDSRSKTTAFASKRVAEDGLKVRFMYRDDPAHPGDSGWKFFHGDEPQEYVDDPGNVGEFALRDIVAVDASIEPLLGTPAPCAFERDSDDAEFRESDFDLWLEE